MAKLPNCPVCDKPTHYGERSAFHLSFGETPIVCDTHGEVGYRDHDFGDTVMYKRDKVIPEVTPDKIIPGVTNE